jgi:hypothetical protein
MKIINLARTYIGEQEISGNQGFKSARLQNELSKDGWRKGEAWCCYLQEMLWEEAYPEHETTFDKLFSANCVQTLENFRKAGYEISTIPKLGSLGIMRQYVDNKPTSKGHALLVTELRSHTEWKSVEGNTTGAGVREGELVWEQIRSLMYKPTGLRMEGFVLIREHLNIVT